MPTCSSQGSSLPLLPRYEGLASLKEKQVSLAVDAKGRQGVILALGSSCGVPSLFLGFQMQPPSPPPCVLGKKYLMNSLNWKILDIHQVHLGVRGGQAAPHGKGSLDQFSRPVQGSEPLPQTFIQGWLATWLLVFFYQPPFRGQSCPVVSPGHSKDRWAAGSSAQSHTRNHSFVSHFRVIIELLVERVF